MTALSDDEIMELAGSWFYTGENQKRDDGYYYRSLGTPSNVRGSDLIEFARALLAAQPAGAMQEARKTLLIAAANFGGLAPAMRDRCIRDANALHEAYTAQPRTDGAQWDASQIKQPGWHHVEGAFIEGAREAKENPDADDAMFRRAADGYTKRVFEEVDPKSERRLRTGDFAAAQPAVQQPAEDAGLLDRHGKIRGDLKASAYCVGNEYKPFHPSASHVRPEWRDGWNACFVAAIKAQGGKQ